MGTVTLRGVERKAVGLGFLKGKAAHGIYKVLGVVLKLACLNVKYGHGTLAKAKSLSN